LFEQRPRVGSSPLGEYPLCEVAEQHVGTVQTLHELFIAAAEKPLLDVVLRHAGGNQSRAAEWLGINRNTLHRKLVDHGLLP
jgi:DNA-binding protein Fis